jgi:hypothetical protein
MPAILIGFFHNFPLALRANSGIIQRLDYDIFLPNPLEFYIASFYLSTPYALDTDSVVQWLSKGISCNTNLFPTDHKVSFYIPLDLLLTITALRIIFIIPTTYIALKRAFCYLRIPQAFTLPKCSHFRHSIFSILLLFWLKTNQKANKLGDFSPQANYTDRATAVFRRS